MIEQIRALLSQNSILPCDAGTLSDDANLYDAGLSSFGSVQLMLAIEETFDVEFPEEMLTRRTFSSIAGIAAAVSELTSQAA
jgi:acyl carrier protein